MKKFNLFAIMFLIGIGGTSTAFAKGHYPVTGFGKLLDHSIIREGGVAGVNVDGIGFQRDGSFAGVSKDMELDLKYGQDIVAPLVKSGPRRIVRGDGR